MKYFILSGLALAGMASASNVLKQTEDALNQENAKYDSLTKSEKKKLRSTGGMRAITQTDMDLVNEYGCWCYFQDGYGAGKSKPVDEIDTLCKRLHDGYTCAIMDALDMGTECVPWEIAYNSAVGSGMIQDMDINTIREECDVQNPEIGCPNWVCKIEGYFIQQLVLYFTHGGFIDHNLRHANGFNPNAECPTTTGINSAKACCDEYPLRFPFKTYGGSRDCCHTKTFNTNLYSCCPDGSVRMSC